FGIADLVVAVTMGAMTSPGRAHLLAFEAPNLLVTSYPLVMVPTFAVPLALMLHGLVLWRLRRGAAPAERLAAAPCLSLHQQRQGGRPGYRPRISASSPKPDICALMRRDPARRSRDQRLGVPYGGWPWCWGQLAGQQRRERNSPPDHARKAAPHARANLRLVNSSSQSLDSHHRPVAEKPVGLVPS